MAWITRLHKSVRKTEVPLSIQPMPASLHRSATYFPRVGTETSMPATSAPPGSIQTQLRFTSTISDTAAAPERATEWPSPDDPLLPLYPPLQLPPNLDDSPAVLEYIGFTPQKSAELWSAWSCISQQPAFNQSFISWVIGQLEDFKGDEADFIEKEWRDYMTTIGLTTEDQNCMLDPRFAMVLETANCVYWVTETIEGRYGYLDMIRSEAREAGHATSSGSHSSIPISQQATHPRADSQS